MSVKFRYNKVIKYLVFATCTEPLHIGSATGEKETVLVHSVDDIPFIQASSLAGVFRDYCEKTKGKKETESLFGTCEFSEKENVSEKGSKVRFSDGMFKKNVMLELRPRVSINPVSGTSDSSIISGTEQKAGNKFHMEYIGAGAEFTFALYLYDVTKQENLEEIFSAFSNGVVQIGGQKSNGCGYIEIDKLYVKEFDLKIADGRNAWAEEDSLPLTEYEDVTKKICQKFVETDVYEFIVSGKTESTLLVKSIAVTEYGKDVPDYVNIQNVKQEYIVPASSFKGAIRSQMQKIAEYLDCKEVIFEAFGTTGDSDTQGKAGCVRFYDTVVGEKEENDKTALSHRIHIDKFTGGVMHGGLFTEKNVFGTVNFRIKIKACENRERICGILLMALRDLAIGMISIGGGVNVGKGMIEVSFIKIENPKEQITAEIDFVNDRVIDDNDMIRRWMRAVKVVEA